MIRSSRAPRVQFAANLLQLARSPVVPDPHAPSLSRADFSARRWGRVSMQRQADARVQRLGGETMGTHWSLRLANPEFAALESVEALVCSVLDRVIAQMSNWVADSAISRFNAAPVGSTHIVAPQFACVLGAALEWARKSDGAMDPAMGALVSLWGFGPRAEPLAAHAGKVPSEADIAGSLKASGFARVQFDLEQRSLLQPGGLELDLCGIAKGFAVDWVVQTLQEAGWNNGLFEIGGELRSWGTRPDGAPWQIQLGTPGGPASQEPMVVGMRNGALATSGDYWHHFSADGTRYSHTLDPRTGRPIEHALESVTVYHPECMHADALATVLTVLGAERGMEFAHSHDIAAVFCERTPGASPQITPAWSARFDESTSLP